MAEVTLSLVNDLRADALPPLCIRCGRRAWGTRRLRLPGPASGVGLLVGDSAADNLERMLTSKGGIALPVCWWHRWIVPPAISIKSFTEKAVTLTGVSSDFITAFQDTKKRG